MRTYFLAADFHWYRRGRVSFSSVGKMTDALRSMGDAIEEACPLVECRSRETDLILLYRREGTAAFEAWHVGDQTVSGGKVIGYLNNGNPALFQLFLIVRDERGKEHVSSLWELADPVCCSGLIGKIEGHLEGLGL